MSDSVLVDNTEGANGGEGYGGTFGIVLIGGDKEGFGEMKAWGEKIKVNLRDSDLGMKVIKESMADYGLGESLLDLIGLV